jgi:NADH-quinone oxidoreductase subunit M
MILSLLCAIPLVGAVLTALLGRRIDGRLVGMAASIATLVVAIVVACRYHRGDGLQMFENHSWITQLGVHWALGVDGLGLLMVLLTACLVPIVFLASWTDLDTGAERPTRSANRAAFYAWALGLEAFALVVFCAQDVFVFYVFFEATLIPAYFLIGGFGKEGRSGAALKFLMYQLGGGLILLASVVGLYAVSAKAGTPSYLISDLQKLDIGTDTGRWLFLGFLTAFIVKAPLFPLHTWLADTTEHATPGTSVLLVCVLDKIGTFGMLRYCLGLFPEASHWATPLVIVLALISIVYGALLAIGSDDLLRLIGLTSLSHFGFITLGIFVFTSQGESGSITYMVNHGVATAAMFLAAGFLIKRTGTSSISQMGGMEIGAPVLAGLFLVAGLATCGLPGLSQFVSEILVMIAVYQHYWLVGVIAVTALVLGAIYVLWAYQRIFTGPALAESAPGPAELGPGPAELGPGPAESAPSPHESAPGRVTGDLNRREIGVLAPLALALVVLGFGPQLMLNVVNPYVSTVLQQVGVLHDPAPKVPALAEGAGQ